jgi:hypothetical protein
MYKHQILSLHTPMFIAAKRSRGMRGLRRGMGAAIPLQLSVDSPQMIVGQAAKFRLIGAPPNSEIYWSSYKNGAATGELNASYQQFTEANGTAEIVFTPEADHVGKWVKEILLKDGAGQIYTAMVQFSVFPATSVQTTTATPTPTSTSFLDTLTEGGFNIGGTFIPYLWAGGAAIAGYFLFAKGKGR